jgi:hypothetical protein
VAAAEAARRHIADCDDRLAKYRAALDAGADPVVVAGWIAEVRRERQRAATLLKDATPAPPLTKAEIKALVLGLADIANTLHTADPDKKAEVYAELGISIRYEPDERVIVAQTRPALACSRERVGGGIPAMTTPCWEARWAA